MKIFNRLRSKTPAPAVFSVEVWDDEKVRVTMRRGDKVLGVGTMTPAEARQVANGLTAAADTIDRKERT